MPQRVFALALATLLLIDPVSPAGAPTAYAASAGASRAAGIAPAIERSVALPAQSAAAKATELAALPLSFVPNAGQTDQRVRFTARSMGGTLFFAADAVALALPAPSTTLVATGQRVAPQWTTTRLRFVGANPNPVLRADAPLPGTVNYFFGNDPARWHTDLPTYAGVVYNQLYPGVDLRYDGSAGRMKGTYMLAPNADPAQIRCRYSNAALVTTDAACGSLTIVLNTPGRRAGSLASRGDDEAAAAVLTEQAPSAWQMIDGRQVPVAVRYVLGRDGTIGFALGAYDRSQPLTIDPTLDYSTYYTAGFGTYLGGSNYEDGVGIAVDSDQNVYVTGPTTSTDFLTQTPLQPTCSGGCAQTDVYVAKLNPTATTLLYSTFLDGTGNDSGSAIAVDGMGRMVVVGTTQSPDFPTASATQATCGDTNCASGDAFVAVLAADGRTLETSTYLGGAGYDYGYDVTLGAADAVFVTGATTSTNFPPARPYQGTNNGGSSDAFVARLNVTPSPISVSISDAQGNPVRKLRANADGWPALNDDVPESAAEAITVTVTVRNTTNGVFRPVAVVSFNSPGSSARFYIFSKPIDTLCSPPIDAFTQTSVEATCTPVASLQPGETATYKWGLWIQPSKAATLQATATLLEFGGVALGSDSAPVQIPRATVRPIVFLHGILGSMTPQNNILTTTTGSGTGIEEELDPFLGSYTPLMTNLQKMGLELGRSLFPLTYDWRQPNDVSAKFLADSLLQNGPIRSMMSGVEYLDASNKVDLVAHSMGGLVSRAYIQGPNYPQTNGRCATLCSSPRRTRASPSTTRRGRG